MNKELSLRTLAYLIGYYKSHDETTINLQEIEAINFILDENEQLQQENKQLKEQLDKLKNELEKDKMEQFDDYVIYLLEKYLSILGENNE